MLVQIVPSHLLRRMTKQSLDRLVARAGLPVQFAAQGAYLVESRALFRTQVVAGSILVTERGELARDHFRGDLGPVLFPVQVFPARRYQNNRRRVADALGISERSVYRWLQRAPAE